MNRPEIEYHWCGPLPVDSGLTTGEAMGRLAGYDWLPTWGSSLGHRLRVCPDA